MSCAEDGAVQRLPDGRLFCSVCNNTGGTDFVLHRDLKTSRGDPLGTYATEFGMVIETADHDGELRATQKYYDSGWHD